MRTRTWFVLAAIVLGSLAASSAWAQKAIQTQMGMVGDVEVDVVKAAVQEGILTVVLAYRNTGANSIKIQVGFADVYYLDDVEKKKFHVLRDSQNAWIAAPTDRQNQIETWVNSRAKLAVWFKFPAPSDQAKTINLVIPGVLPFEKLPITR